MRRIGTYLISFIWIALAGCGNSDYLPRGIWRGVLKTSSGTDIPFNFELSDSYDGLVVHIINGDDRFRVENVTTAGDSIFIKIPLFDSEIRAAISGGTLSGKWIKHLPGKHPEMKFNAQSGVRWRFFEETDDVSKHNIEGRWSTVFKSMPGTDSTFAVGEFQYRGERLTGTFLTTTGDYRFLEGTLHQNKIYLSTFDGSDAYLFTGTVENDSTIVDGKFYSGLTSAQNWRAHKDPNAILPDAYALTKLKAGRKNISFSFPDLEGKKVSLSDPRFKDKVVIVQFLGSWCPNCMDETAFLAPFYKKYRNKGVEIIGLAYERTSDFETSKRKLKQLKERLNVTYPLLITGFTNKEVPKSIPSLNEFKAFPTTIIIDKKGEVTTIHTGFSGPGTGKHYADFIREFENRILGLLNGS